MGIWRRELSAFIACLWAEWVTLLTGGVPAALLVVWGYAKAEPITTKLGYGFLGFTLLIAVFFSWRKQWRVADADFIEVGPKALIGLWLGKTSPHATSILKPYLGRRIRVTGAFVDIRGDAVGFRYVLLNCDQVLVGANIPFWQANDFSSLPKGAEITVTGTITKIDSAALEIRGIEIVAGPLQMEVRQ